MSWILLISITEWTIRLVMAGVVLRRRFDPPTALAWLMLIFLFPAVGLVLYLLVGVSYLGKRRARSHRRLVGPMRRPDRLTALRAHAMRPDIEPQQEPMIIQAERISGNPIMGGNDVELLMDTSEKIRRLCEDIDAAADHVHLLYYIYRPDETGAKVTETLLGAAKRGVACRVLVDAVGSRPFLRDASARRLRAAGVEVHEMLPVAPWRRKLARMDLRNHRKVAVIDGRVAYTGSHNIVLETYGHRRAGKWVDLSGRFTGPVVAQLQQVFLEDWLFTTDRSLEDESLFPSLEPTGEVPAQAVPTGPNHEGETFRRVLVAALNAAQRHIIITTPYLVPDEPTLLALSMAVDRGAKVELVVPARSDHPLVSAASRFYFQALMDTGVVIHRYRNGMLHAKTATIDDSFALLGSANIDIRSFHLNFEINVLLYGPQITSTLRFAQRRYMAESEPLDAERWSQRPKLSQYAEGAAALVSPLL